MHLAQVDNEVDRRLYISCHSQQVILFNTCIHPAQQQAAVCMLNHSSQLKSLLLGSKLPDSDLLLTSNPDKPLTSTFQSAVLLFPILQNEGNAAFVTLTQPPVELPESPAKSVAHEKHLSKLFSAFAASLYMFCRARNFKDGHKFSD